MSATTAKATIERRRSHGIGGAGNMHLPSVSKKAQDAPNGAEGNRCDNAGYRIPADYLKINAVKAVLG
ncbi:hypothetical protein LTR12_001180 [Friedmanniomyces endolithicus]|nr:hypothetical protein LTR74_005736 [Friedmanniomyces endolithicus]KAK1824342.1 hypothetical protein LTR12_001180 [Friedmanniomyces endolithicus]